MSDKANPLLDLSASVGGLPIDIVEIYVDGDREAGTGSGAEEDPYGSMNDALERALEINRQRKWCRINVKDNGPYTDLHVVPSARAMENALALLVVDGPVMCDALAALNVRSPLNFSGRSVTASDGEPVEPMELIP